MKKICDICGASFETKSPTRIIVMTVVQIQQEIYIWNTKTSKDYFT